MWVDSHDLAFLNISDANDTEPFRATKNRMSSCLLASGNIEHSSAMFGPSISHPVKTDALFSSEAALLADFAVVKDSLDGFKALQLITFLTLSRS
jgi:hypothetical protein